MRNTSIVDALTQFRLGLASATPDLYSRATSHRFDVILFNAYWTVVQTLGYFLLISITQVGNRNWMELRVLK